MSTPNNKPRDLTHRDYIIAQELSKGASKTDAYLCAFPGQTVERAQANASRYLKKNPHVRQRAIDIIESRDGLTLSKALEHLERSLHASYKDKWGQQQDNSVQLEACKVLLKLHGELSDAPQIDARQVNVHVSEAKASSLDALIAKMQALNSSHDVIEAELGEVREIDS
jgi:hypothetical protein